MPKLEGYLFPVAEAAKTDMKRPSLTTGAEGSGKVYIRTVCHLMLVTQASSKMKTVQIMEILHCKSLVCK